MRCSCMPCVCICVRVCVCLQRPPGCLLFVYQAHFFASFGATRNEIHTASVRQPLHTHCMLNRRPILPPAHRLPEGGPPPAKKRPAQAGEAGDLLTHCFTQRTRVSCAYACMRTQMVAPWA